MSRRRAETCRHPRQPTWGMSARTGSRESGKGYRKTKKFSSGGGRDRGRQKRLLMTNVNHMRNFKVESK